MKDSDNTSHDECQLEQPLTDERAAMQQDVGFYNLKELRYVFLTGLISLFLSIALGLILKQGYEFFGATYSLPFKKSKTLMDFIALLLEAGFLMPLLETLLFQWLPAKYLLKWKVDKRVIITLCTVAFIAYRFSRGWMALALLPISFILIREMVKRMEHKPSTAFRAVAGIHIVNNIIALNLLYFFPN